MLHDTWKWLMRHTKQDYVFHTVYGTCWLDQCVMPEAMSSVTCHEKKITIKIKIFGFKVILFLVEMELH